MGSLRVGFDLSFAPAPGSAGRSGLARVVENLTAALEQRGVLEVVRLAPPPGIDVRRWRRKELVPSVTRHGLVGLHSFTSSFPFTGPGRRVQTVHELPWRNGAKENAGWKHRLWARLGPLRADRVVCPTHFVARDLGAYALGGRARIQTCPWGVGPPFAGEAPTGVVDEALLARYRLPDDPLVICPGAVRPKKNLAALLRGLAELERRRGPRLFAVVTGPDTPGLRADLGLASRLGIAGRVLTPGIVPDDDWPSLLRLASAVAVLSTSEGFGLPVLEGLASGTPVVVAAGSASAEVAGSAGLLVDGEQPEEVADALQRAVDEREALRWPALERAAEFPWERSAECVESIWRELAG